MPLDAASLQPKVLLLLDCFFHVIIWRGDTIQQWFEANYQNLPEFAHFRELLENPSRDALELIQDGGRVPVPKFVQTYANGSQARFLLARMNPSGERGEGGTNVGGGASIREFMESLIKACVEDD